MKKILSRIVPLSLGSLVLTMGLTVGTCWAEAASLPPAKDALHWWNDTVFYEIYVRSFHDSRKGELADDGLGDIAGLIEKLDYLNDGNPSTQTDLGITGIWLMPVAQSAHPAGYSVLDYNTVESDYGTNDDFKKLIAESHKRGIRVIVDLVLNHCSIEHPWFLAAGDPASPYHEYFVWRDERPIDQGQKYAHQWYEHENGKWFYAQFGRGVPDLNVENPAVKKELFKIASFWLNEMNVDGFRLDAVKHLVEDGPVDEHTEATHQWLREFQAHCKNIKPESFIVGEVWSGTDAVAQYGTDELDLAFQFELAGAMISASGNGRAGNLSDKQANVAQAFEPLQYAPFLANHDMARSMEQVDRDFGKARVAAAMLLTAPGVPFVYYGEEVGISGLDSKGRSPMQWSAGENAGFSTVTPYRKLEDEWERYNVEAQTGDPDSLLSTYRELIQLRSEHSALRRGNYIPLQINPPALENYTYSLNESPALYGYKVAQDSVTFIFDPEIAAQAYAGGGHEDHPFDKDHIESVSVAGDFNAWSPTVWEMTRNEDGTYTRTVGQGNFSLEFHEFKFVVNGSTWIEPPTASPNRKHAGLEHESYNLVLNRHEDQKPEGYRIVDGKVHFQLSMQEPIKCLDEQSGAMRFVDRNTIEKVTLVASFNDWSKEMLELKLSENVWSLEFSNSQLRDPAGEFRYLLNDRYWVVPSSRALNCKESGTGSPLYAFLRSDGEESLLVIINPSNEIVSEYNVFSNSDTALGGSVVRAVNIATGEELPTPEISSNGGIYPYRPLTSLPPRSYSIISFQTGPNEIKSISEQENPLGKNENPS